MENKNLIKSGLDASQILISYLSKDAMGSDFLKNYLSDSQSQNENSRKQQEILSNLVDDTNAINEETRGIAEKAMENNSRLTGIYNEVSSLKDSVLKLEEEHKLYEERFTQLSHQIDEITHLVNSIKKISSQTRLLSFNASIEAARAGSAGKGFRIIATEVKSLSDDTDKTSETIKEKMSVLVSSISALAENTRVNSASLSSLAAKTDETLSKFENVRALNSENNSLVGTVSNHVESSISAMNSMLANLEETERDSRKTSELFAKSASENEMLFNDLYSFAYEIKAIFEELQKTS